MNEVSKRFYPYIFFCEERYSEERLFELFQLYYNHLYTDAEERYDLEIPTLGVLHHYATSIYLPEMIARIILRNDYSEESGMSYGFAEFVREEFQYEQLPLDEFIDRMSERLRMYSINAKYHKNMEQDMRLIFLKTRTFFIDVESSYDASKAFKRWKSENTDFTAKIRNAPIVGVW